MPRQIREILASVRETGDRGRNTGAPGKYGRSGNPTPGATLTIICGVWGDMMDVITCAIFVDCGCGERGKLYVPKNVFFRVLRVKVWKYCVLTPKRHYPAWIRVCWCIACQNRFNGLSSRSVEKFCVQRRNKKWVVTLAMWGEVTPGATLTMMWCVGRYGRPIRNHVCNIWWLSVNGCGCGERGKFVLSQSHSLDASRPYNNCHTTVWPCDVITANGVLSISTGSREGVMWNELNHGLHGSAGTVLTAITLSYGKWRNSTPRRIKTPSLVEMKLWTYDYVREICPQIYFCKNRCSGGFWRKWWNITSQFFL